MATKTLFLANIILNKYDKLAQFLIKTQSELISNKNASNINREVTINVSGGRKKDDISQRIYPFLSAPTSVLRHVSFIQKLIVFTIDNFLTFPL